MLLNACKDISLAVNIGKMKNMEIGRHRGIMAKDRIMVGRNSYEEVKTFKYLGSLCQPRWSRGNVITRDPRFAGSNPNDIKILSTSPPEEILSRGSRV